MYLITDTCSKVVFNKTYSRKTKLLINTLDILIIMLMQSEVIVQTRTNGSTIHLIISILVYIIIVVNDVGLTAFLMNKTLVASAQYKNRKPISQSC